MSDDEGYDEVEDLLDQSSRSRNLSTFAVSGWDNDDDGIEKDPNPHVFHDVGRIVAYTVDLFSCVAYAKWTRENLTSSRSTLEKYVKKGKTPDKELLWAAEHSVIQVVRKIVEQNPALVHAKDKDGYTPLHRACYNDHVDIVKYLLMNGARHDAETLDKWQPLHSACHWNSLKSAATLIAFGADVNTKSAGGVTPLHLAAQRNDAKDLIQLLLAQPELKASELDSANDAPIDIARRAGNMEKYFEILDPCFV